MRKIICGIDAPFPSSVGMFFENYPICNNIPHVWIVVGDVHFKSKRSFPLSIITFSHSIKFKERFLDRAVPPWAWRLILLQLLTLLNFLTGHVANICFVLLDEIHSKVIQLLERIRRICNLIWVMTHILNILNNVVDVFLLLGFGVRIVETKESDPPKLLCHTKVEVHSLCMSDVKVSIGLRGESCSHLTPSALDMGTLNLFRVLVPWY
mmetsp:Transcript_18803/g.46101  ORF Transcript_18803/g.46101 Transcript_18803/m.46101 type:complete len:209 (-) Transcript_18803:741-1367(-)